MDIVTEVKAILALQEENKALREQFFRTIDKAVLYQEIGDRIDWDGLVVSLPSLEKMDLEYVLDILALSGQQKYLSLLEKYARHSDPEIQQWACEAIEELNDMITRATDPQEVG